MRVSELLDILRNHPADAEVELAMVASVTAEADDITVDRFAIDGVLPWEDDEDGDDEGGLTIWLIGGEDVDVDIFLDAIEQQSTMSEDVTEMPVGDAADVTRSFQPPPNPAPSEPGEEWLRLEAQISDWREQLRSLENVTVVPDGVPESQMVMWLVSKTEEKLDRIYFNQRAIYRWNGNPFTKMMPSSFMETALSGRPASLFWFAKADANREPIVIAEVTRSSDGIFNLKFTEVVDPQEFPFRNS